MLFPLKKEISIIICTYMSEEVWGRVYGETYVSDLVMMFALLKITVIIVVFDESTSRFVPSVVFHGWRW